MYIKCTLGIYPLFQNNIADYINYIVESANNFLNKKVKIEKKQLLFLLHFRDFKLASIVFFVFFFLTGYISFIFICQIFLEVDKSDKLLVPVAATATRLGSALNATRAV